MLKRQKGFSKETKDSVKCGQHGFCHFCEEKIDDYHHMLHNTATNRKLFPIFIHSIFNCKGLCRADHELRQNEIAISEDMAREYEGALRTMNDYTEMSTLAEVMYGSKTKPRQSYSGTNTTLPKVRKAVSKLRKQQ